MGVASMAGASPQVGTTPRDPGLPSIVSLPVAPGTIIGDEDHLFWRKGLEVHVRVWELSAPVCYAAQIHAATPLKEPLGVLFMDKQSVDKSLYTKKLQNNP